jgi:hypothetical protein
MTFTEAAIEVLRREGKPLHFRKITEIAVRDALLDHVGKIPEEIMADQLSAHSRLPKTERRLLPVQQGTFALVEWGFDEDPQGLEGLVEPPPEGEKAYRGRERHPIPSSQGRGRGERERDRERDRDRPRRRDEEGRHGKRFPPPAEVAYEILAGAGHPLSLREIASQGAERLLMPDAFVRETASLEAALVEDNRRREAAGRKPLFAVDADTVSLVAQPEPGERPAVAPAAARPQGAAELRRAALAGLRRRLRECDGPTVEHLAERLLEQLGFREVKVAKRGREHVVLTARRKLGLAEIRHAVRVVRSGADALRKDVQDTRRDLGAYGAQIGMVLTAGEAAREARSEATAAGQLPVLLLAGEALAEAFAEAGVGTVPVIVPEIDEAFFQSATEAAQREEAARRARREERDRREGREPREVDEGREGREGRDERRDDRRERRDRRERGDRSERAPERQEAAAQAAREGQASAEGEVREVDATLAVAEPAGSGTGALEVAASLDAGPGAGPEPTPSAAALALAGELDLDDDEDGPEEPDDEGDDDEPAQAGASAPAAGGEGEARPGDPGKPGEGRRRRRRRRRRGGRGRGRGEGGAQAAAQPGAEGAPAAGPAEPGGAPAPPPASEPGPSGPSGPSSDGPPSA